MTHESALFEKLKVYKNYANDCLFFKYIFDENDLAEADSKKTQDQTNIFKPEFTHQIFGDEEIIFGYKNLKINYYLTPGTLEAYIGLTYKEKISPQRFEGIEPDDVLSSFVEFGCSPGFTTNLNVFRSEKMVQDLEFRPFGIKISEYARDLITNDNKSTENFEIYKVCSSLPEHQSKKFADYLMRVQTMLVYYIETSSFVDNEDTQWTYFLLYEKRKDPLRYVTVGYVSVYNYYAYPDKTRSRISQVMIFPQYQNNGHGAELLESIYKDGCQNSTIIDITVESPSSEFIHLRDFVTTKMCFQALDSFKDISKLKNGYNNEMMLEALKKLKIPKLQSRRCYEILRLSATNQNNSQEWANYRLDLKKRFYFPFIRRSKYTKNNVNNLGENGSTSGSSGQKSLTLTNGFNKSSKETNLENRFGNSNGCESKTTNGFDTSSKRVKFGEEEETTNGFHSSSKRVKFGEEEETTIGFGKSSKSVSFNSFSKLSSNEPKPIKNGKSVSFAAVSSNGTSLNTSNSTTDASHDSTDDENERAGGLSKANLFINEKERKKYLEEQFQESVTDYLKTLKRLEKSNILIN